MYKKLSDLLISLKSKLFYNTFKMVTHWDNNFLRYVTDFLVQFIGYISMEFNLILKNNFLQNKIMEQASENTFKLQKFLFNNENITKLLLEYQTIKEQLAELTNNVKFFF